MFEVVAEVAAGIAEGSGRRLADWLRRTVSGTGDLPLARLLRDFGIDYHAGPAASGPALGVKLAADGSEAKLANVLDGGAAQSAGLSAGDVLIAMDGLKITAGNLDELLARRKPGERVRIHAFRRDELIDFDVTLAPAPSVVVALSRRAKSVPSVQALRKGWVGG